MRILVTGASSFVGAHIARLAARDHTVLALHHSTPLRLNGVTPVRLDLRRRRTVVALDALAPDAVIHVACRIRVAGAGDPAEAAVLENRAMMDSVLALGRPVIYASSTVVHWHQDTPYARGRLDDEQRLVESRLPYAILRPSAPYGPRLVNHAPQHKESFHTLADLVRRSPLVPVIGDGQYRRQPVHVDDFAGAALALLERGPLPCGGWDAGGADALTFDEIVDTIARAAHRQVRKLHLPKALFISMARFSKDFDASLLAAIDEDELAPPGPLAEVTGFSPRRFADGVHDLLR